AEIGEVEAQREAGLEQIAPRRYVVVRAIDVDARHPLSPRTAFELDVPLEIPPETFKAAFERLHGAGRARAEGFARTEEIGMHFQNLQIAHLSLSGIDRRQEPLQIGRAIPTGCAPAARFLRE